MSHAHQRTDSATPIQGAVRSVAWLFRWLLVVLLVLDQVGTPLHRHHHDAGADGSAVHGQHLGSLPAVGHIEDDRHPSVFHVVTTLRTESRVSAQGASDEAPPQPAALNGAWVMPARSLEPSGSVSWARSAVLSHRLHPSLPPASRAPPLHA